MTLYYEVAVTGHNLKPLTYSFSDKLPLGSIVEIPVSKKQKSGVVLREVEKPEFKTQPITSVSPSLILPAQLELAKFISSYYVCEIAVSLALFEPLSVVDAEAKTGIDITYGAMPPLSEKQNEAFEFLRAAPVSLLFGDTGSGKTQIYISLIKEALQNGKTAIFLMPEIGLTPQMLKRLKEVFGDLVGVWHSKQSKKTKAETLSKIISKEIRVVAGPRSALFLPLRDIGVIVVDEEHDDSYKSGSSPRYNAKDMAVTYAKILGAKCVLGSATPSLSSYKNYPVFRLKESFFSGKKEFIFEQKETEIDDFLIFELKKCIDSGSQAVVFLPTRANYKYIVCKSCGSGVECPFCSVSMSLHSDENRLKCHYCGYSEKIDLRCKSCGAEEMGVFRMGTQEAVEKISARLPDAIIKKFDRDEIKTQKELEKTLKEFEQGKISILVGTQMLSKGHDYHNIKLAVVLGLDSILLQNDFRASERAASLLVQIAGRAGRSADAKIIVQTLNGDFFKSFLGSYESFLDGELKTREGLYPPFARMARLIFSGQNREKTQADMLKSLQGIQGTKAEVVGYGDAAIGRIAGKHRFDILLRSPSAKTLLDAIYAIDDKSFEVDMDPVSFS